MSASNVAPPARGPLNVVLYLCQGAVTEMRSGALEHAAQFLVEASDELCRGVAAELAAAEAAAEAAEAEATRLRAEADALRARARRVHRRVERLSMFGYRLEIAAAAPRRSDVRELSR